MGVSPFPGDNLTFKSVELHILLNMQNLNGDIEYLVEEYIRRISGEEGLIIFKSAPQKEFTDEEISVQTGLDLNSVRRALFLLYEAGLAEYRREKDEDSGWLTYYWKINTERTKEVIRRELEKARKNFIAKIEYESGNMFYYCEGGCGKFVFEEAMSFNFSCPNCERPLQYADNTRLLEFLENEIKKIESFLAML